MNIIIPLGGKGERFQKEGYLEPKPLIKVLNKEILFYTIDNLSITEEDKIFIIYNKDLDSYNFKEIINNKYPKINLIKLEFQTKGASETVYIGLSEIISNYDYHKKIILLDGDTFYNENILEKFRNINNKNVVFYTKNYEENPIFSYIKLDDNNNIISIKEKDKISDNANTGAYAFDDINSQHKYFLNYKKGSDEIKSIIKKTTEFKTAASEIIPTKIKQISSGFMIPDIKMIYNS
jgi:dTDP-glucose pyrophosphorylase